METKSMKSIILIFNVIILFSCNNHEKNYFEVMKKDRFITQEKNPVKEVYYGINLTGKNNSLTYPLDFSNYSGKEKIIMIKEVLRVEGD